MINHSINLNPDIPNKTWEDERLAIPCCWCFKLLNRIKELKKNFKESFKKIAVINLDLYIEDNNNKTFSKRLYFTEREVKEYIITILKHKLPDYSGYYINKIINNLTKWNILI